KLSSRSSCPAWPLLRSVNSPLPRRVRKIPLSVASSGCQGGFRQIQRDQVTDYAFRKGMSIEDVERWLAPNLGYDAD
ncbi:hypothetical protein MJN76_32940, partial [Salmonella enterica subsp. enterica serovar Anatum]|nr:hypothetical protein [Salmonella enterica subsp. enterica serovar Anatum]